MFLLHLKAVKANIKAQRAMIEYVIVASNDLFL